LENYDAGTTLKGGKRQVPATSGSSIDDLANAEKTASEKVRELAEESAEKLGDLAAGARETISENPWVSTLSVFAVGLVTGVLLGALLGRD
jgi:ElaB/YqjD/DUF883 family membrane-anchored ribosome-binding protein